MKSIKSIGMVLAVMLMLSGIGAANISNGVSLSGNTNTPPVITVTGSNPVIVERYSTYTDAGATATDIEDNLAGIPLNIITTGSVDTAVVGTYTITYTVTDSQGATDIKTRTINVQDTVAPADITDLVVDAVTTNSIDLTWKNTAPLTSPDFTTILITVIKNSDGSVILNKKSIGLVESYTISGLEPGQQYDITVYTKDDQP